MNIHIHLEEITIDTKLKKDCLLSILKEYPLFKETPLEESNYLIIIPNYPNSGIQNFSYEIDKMVFVDSSSNIEDNNIFLLDSDNTLLKFNVSKSSRNQIYFDDKNFEITDIFGFTPKQIEEAANYIKFGKHFKKEDRLVEEARQMEMDNFFNPPLPLSNKKTNNINNRKKLLL